MSPEHPARPRRAVRGKGYYPLVEGHVGGEGFGKIVEIDVGVVAPLALELVLQLLRVNVGLRLPVGGLDGQAHPLLAVRLKSEPGQQNERAMMGELGGGPKARRRLREIYCLHERQIARGYDLVVVSRVRARTADYHQLEAACLSACAQLGLLTEGDDGV